MTVTLDETTKDFTPLSGRRSRLAPRAERVAAGAPRRPAAVDPQRLRCRYGGELRLIAEFPNRQPVAIVNGLTGVAANIKALREREGASRDRRVIGAGELSDAEIALMATAEVPAEHAHFDEELND